MKNACLILCAYALMGLSSRTFASNISLDSLDIKSEIKAVETEIEELDLKLKANQQTAADRMADLKANSPFFSERSPFESDTEFLERSLKGNKQVKQLYERYLKDLEDRLYSLNNRTFETSNICVELDPKDYKPNEKLWPMSVKICGITTKTKSFSLPIDTDAAKNLWENWEGVSKRGLVMLSPGERIELVQLELVDTLANKTYRMAFPEYAILRGSKKLSDTSQDPTPKIQFTKDSRYLVERRKGSLRVYDLKTGRYHVLKKGVVGGFVVHTLENGDPIVAFFTYECVIGERSSLQPSRSYGRGGKHRTILNVAVLETSPNGVPVLAPPVLTHKFPLSPDQNDFYLHADLATVKRHCEQNIMDVRASVSSPRFNTDATAVSWNFNARSNSRDGYKPTQSVEIATGKPLTIEAATAATWTDSSVTHSRDKRIGFGVTDTRTNSRRRSYQTGRKKSLIAAGDGTRQFHCASWIGYTKSPDGSVTCVDLKSSTNNVASSTSLSPNGDYYAVAWPDKTMVWRTLSQPTKTISRTPGRTPRTSETSETSETASNSGNSSLAGPPMITADLTFEEPSGNQILDANETGTILLTLKNEGQGPANGLRVVPSPTQIDHLHYGPVGIDRLAPGQSTTLKMPIAASNDIITAEHTLRFEFEVANGFSPQPIELTFMTSPQEISLTMKEATDNTRSISLKEVVVEPEVLIEIPNRARNPTPKSPELSREEAPKPRPTAVTYGTLNVNVAGTWGNVVIDGRASGTTPFTGKLKSGRHTIRIHNETTGLDSTKKITIRSGETETLAFEP
jgi:hypothetical protein